MPTGSPIRLASPTRISVPTIALAMPPPVFADRLGHVREEMPLDELPAQLDQMEQDEQERQGREHGGRRDQPDHEAIDQVSAAQLAPHFDRDVRIGPPRRLRPADAACRAAARGRAGAATGERTPGVVIRALPPALRETCHTSQRAIALTISVITNSVNPTAMRADRWRSPDASENSLAMSEAMVYPGANSDAEICWAIPDQHGHGHRLARARGRDPG